MKTFYCRLLLASFLVSNTLTSYAAGEQPVAPAPVAPVAAPVAAPVFTPMPDNSQNQRYAWMMYQNNKKSGGTAFLLNFIIPGLGNYYCNDWFGGILLMAANVSCNQAMADAETRHDQKAYDTALSNGLAVGVLAMIWGPLSANSYNKGLRKRYGLVALRPTRDGAGYMLAYEKTF